MKQIKKSWLRATLALTLVLGIGYFAVNASEKKTEQTYKSEIVDLVYFQYDANQNPIPIQDSQLGDYTHPANTNPFSCPTGSAKLCSKGYATSDLELDMNGDWVPKASAAAVEEYRYN